MSSETSEQQFTNTPAGWASRLKEEFAAARKALKPWHDEAEEALKAYLDERNASDLGTTRWNIYTSDTQTREAMLYGKVPQTAVARRFADAQDDVARIAAEAQERILNADIEGADDSFCEALGLANMDREQVGFGAMRVRYDAGEPSVIPGRPAMTKPDPTTGEAMELAPAVPETQTRPNEAVETDYVHWRDFLFGNARVWHEVPWLAFKAQLSRKKVIEAFGEDVADKLPVDAKKLKPEDKPTPWSRTDVWEVWVKEEKQVFFFVEGYGETLSPLKAPAEENGGVRDPLGLTSFYPCAKPMFANLTTSKLVPKTDYALAKGQYREIDDLTARIQLLQEALRVVGIYDKTNTALMNLLQSGRGNEMVPADNWGMAAEKGGIRGAVDWFPLEQVVNALTVLREYRAEAVDALRQITGMSDIMRGQATTGGTTATEQSIKARFGSVRMQKRQDELARFASDHQRLRAEVMAKHFSPDTYVKRSNMEQSPDAAMLPQAVALLQSEIAKFRIEVKPEALSMTDFDALKQERTEVVAAIASYLQVAGPLAQTVPTAGPALLKILQWLISGLRGSSEIEGVLDQAIAQAEQAAQQPQQPAQQDPKLLQIQTKGQVDMQKAQMDHHLDIEKIGVEVQAEEAKQRAQTEWNVKEQVAKNAIKPPPQVEAPHRSGPMR